MKTAESKKLRADYDRLRTTLPYNKKKLRERLIELKALEAKIKELEK
jgi:hypothetical protein